MRIISLYAVPCHSYADHKLVCRSLPIVCRSSYCTSQTLERKVPEFFCPATCAQKKEIVTLVSGCHTLNQRDLVSSTFQGHVQWPTLNGMCIQLLCSIRMRIGNLKGGELDLPRVPYFDNQCIFVCKPEVKPHILGSASLAVDAASQATTHPQNRTS